MNDLDLGIPRLSPATTIELAAITEAVNWLIDAHNRQANKEFLRATRAPNEPDAQAHGQVVRPGED